MPILWRFLIYQFLKVTIFCVIAFVLILLTLRLDDIAHFASLGTPFTFILLFTFYQIPYILPIAIPISCLIASLLLIQRLSSSQELTAFRACGYSIKEILTPLLITAAFLSIGNFWIVSEIATQSHLATNQLKSEFRSINPLLLLNNKHLMRLKGIYFDAMGPSHVGESASQVVFAMPNRSKGRLSVILADQIQSTPSHLLGKGLTLLTAMDGGEEEEFDNLILENIGETKILVESFSDALQKHMMSINNDYLKMSLLLTRIKDQKEEIAQLKEDITQTTHYKELKKQFNQSLSEIARRVSIAFATLSFTLMGAAFGMHISRQRKNHGLYLAIFLTLFYLVLFFSAKNVDDKWELSLALYVIPPLLLILSSLFFLNRLTKGIE